MIELVDNFLSEKEGIWSPKTIKTYHYHLSDLANWLSDADIGINNVDTDDIRSWLDTHQNWSVASRHLAICACRSFFRWALGDWRSPSRAIRLPKRRRVPQQTLDQDQVLQVVSSIDTSSPIGIRNVATICLMIDTGLRASEICHLRLEHLDLEERRLVVITKGGNYELKVFSQYTRAMLAHWLSVRSNFAIENVATVFIGIGGLTPGYSMTSHGLRAIFRKLGTRAGIGPFSPHSLRRTFATLALKSGAPTRIVQVAGGWQDLGMVERYSQMIKPSDLDPYFPVNLVMGLEHKS